MTNMLQDGVTFLGGQLKDHCGLSIMYYRGQASVSVTATASMHRYEILDTDGIVTVVTSRDYVVHAADLVIAGSTVTPRAGDTIKETIGSTVHTFEVMPLGAEAAYEPVDPDSVLLTVHTKKIN